MIDWLREISAQLRRVYGFSLHGVAPKTYDVPQKEVVYVWAQELRLLAMNAAADFLQGEELAQAAGNEEVELASVEKWEEVARLVELSVLADFLSCCYIPPLRGGNIATLQVGVRRDCMACCRGAVHGKTHDAYAARHTIRCLTND